jgi:hypothetical protein
MRSRLAAVLGLVVLGCADSTPPVTHPVFHDVSLTFATMQSDIGQAWSPMNQTFDGGLAVNFQTTGARFDFETEPPCWFANGELTVSGSSVSGDFHGKDYGPRLTLSGSTDSGGVMTGTFNCSIRYSGSPHGPNYSGTFRATRRQ